MFKLNFKNIALFVFIWLTSGFALGFLVLLGPLRWVVDFAKNHNYRENIQDGFVKLVIIAFVIVSFIIARRLTALTINTGSKMTKALIPVLCLVCSAFALHQLLNPKLLSSFLNRHQDVLNQQFEFGAYPDVDELRKLKDNGFTNIVTLLHPAVTPFEPVLLGDEERNCKEVGLNLIQVPMLPWISDNADASAKIKDIATHPKGKYYIHCYLGKDRINIFKRLMSGYNPSITSVGVQSKSRSLDSISRFERGPITKLSNGVYFTPYPTDEEYTGFIIGAGVQTVVSLMDPLDAEQKPRIEAEKKILSTYNIRFENRTIITPDQMKQIDELKEEIKRLPKPILIHRFFSDRPDDVAILARLKE